MRRGGVWSGGGIKATNGQGVVCSEVNEQEVGVDDGTALVRGGEADEARHRDGRGEVQHQHQHQQKTGRNDSMALPLARPALRGPVPFL